MHHLVEDLVAVLIWTLLIWVCIWYSLREVRVAKILLHYLWKEEVWLENMPDEDRPDEHLRNFCVANHEGIAPTLVYLGYLTPVRVYPSGSAGGMSRGYGKTYRLTDKGREYIKKHPPKEKWLATVRHFY